MVFFFFFFGCSRAQGQNLSGCFSVRYPLVVSLGVTGEFQLLLPVHSFRHGFKAHRHSWASWYPVRHPASLTWRSSVGFSPTKNLCATPVLTSTRSALPIGALARGGVWDPAEGLICMRTPTGPDYVRTSAYNSHQEPSKGGGPCLVPFQKATVPRHRSPT